MSYISDPAISRVLFAVAFVTIAGTGMNATAQDVSLPGKVNVIIGSPPGGGTDGTSRLLGRFMEKHLPGKPQMIYRYIPAGSGVMACNYLANEATKDGRFWMGGDGGYISPEALRQTPVKYDPRTFKFIGGVSRGGTIMLMRAEKEANLHDKSKPPAVVGTDTGTGTAANMMAWAAEGLGWNYRFVVGYPNTATELLAMKRGEIDISSASDVKLLNELLKDKQLKGLIQFGQLLDGKFVARSSFPDIPVLPVMMEGKLSGTAKEAFEFWLGANLVDKWYALPPGTPDNIVNAYSAAVTETFKDPEFIKMGKLQFSADFLPQTAGDVAQLVATSSYPPPDLVDYVVKLRTKVGLPAQPLTDEQLKELAKKLVKFQTVESTIGKVEQRGRVIHFKAGSENHTVMVSGRRTQVTIAGKSGKQADVKEGMSCKITYVDNGGEAQSVACK